MNKIYLNNSMVIYLIFACNTILLCFLFIDVNFLITAVVAHIFNPTAELAILLGIPASKAKAEIETQPAIADTNISNCLM